MIRPAVDRLLLTGVLVMALSAKALAQPAASDASPQPTLEQVLARATQYVLDYQKNLSGLVSEEHYLQSWRRGSRMPETRALRSDVLLTQPPGGRRYLMFRDVFEVDGRQVRDRDERLQRLFLSPSAVTSTQVYRIIEESARYNIGNVQRTVNTPTLALVFLDPQFQGHFRFERSADRVAETDRAVGGGGTPRFTVPDDLWVIAYEETARDTLMSGGAGLALPASGRFWVEPDSGRVVMTEMYLRNRAVDALVDVRYDMAPAVGVFVPVAMRERYRDLRRDSVIEGSAEYSRVRRFQVSSSEEVKPPPR
jgi:hypothetical protein